jgi:hypothetical protein
MSAFKCECLNINGEKTDWGFPNCECESEKDCVENCDRKDKDTCCEECDFFSYRHEYKPKNTDIFDYFLIHHPNSVLTTEPLITFIYDLKYGFMCKKCKNCKNPNIKLLSNLNKRKLYFNVYNKKPLTYKCAFEEINRQFREQIQALINEKQPYCVEDFLCIHSNITDLTRNSNTEYNIITNSHIYTDNIDRPICNF